MPVPFHSSRRSAVLLRAFLLVVVIALIDWRVDINISFGFLYLFPMLMVGGLLSRWQIVAVAALFTVLVEVFDPFPWVAAAGVPRVVLIFAAYIATGLFVFEAARNRRLAQTHLEQMEQEIRRRRDAEQQLHILIESNPAAIVMLDTEGRILLANEAAHRLFTVPEGRLPGEAIHAFVPALTAVLRQEPGTPSFRTVMQCRSQRRNGEVFLADLWFSTYQTEAGPRLAAVILDASEGLREREEASLEQLLRGSRLLVSAVSHEIRNICGAIGVVHANLTRVEALVGNEDFQALGTLVEALSRMADLELQQRVRRTIRNVDLIALLEELRIIIEPSLRENEITLVWDVPESPLRVWVDRQSLLQVFLNVVKNSERAVASQPAASLRVAVTQQSTRVHLRVFDNGPGVAAPERLFQPFQSGADATGLGLYISRVFLRSFGAEIHYEPQPSGSCFVIDLATLPQEEQQPEGVKAHGAVVTAGRPHTVSRESEPTAR